MRKFLAGILLLLLSSSAHAVSLHTQKVAHIVGTITEETEAQFAVEMHMTRDIPGERLIVIDSPGGYVESGTHMLKLIQAEQARGVKVTCLVIDDASSMAFNILTHCNVRIATVGARMVVHKIAVATLPPYLRGTSAHLRDLAKELDEMDKEYRRANARAMHMTLDSYDFFADRETDWTARDLLARGYLSAVIER